MAATMPVNLTESATTSTSSVSISFHSSVPAPTSLPTGSVCNINAGPSIDFNDTLPDQTDYCQFNYPLYIGNVTAACCAAGAELMVYQNCTQYCHTDMGVQDWSRCVRNNVPALRGRAGFGCGTTTSGVERSARWSWMTWTVVGLALGMLVV